MNTTNNREQSEFTRYAENETVGTKMNYNESDMETMRRQMGILRQKLSQQEIVNERLIRQSMSHNMSRINRRHFLQGLLCLILIPYTYLTFVRQLDFSLLFWGYTSLMMLIVLGHILYTNLHLLGNDVLGRNLLVAQQQVTRARRLEYDWLKIGLPLLARWIAFACYEVYRTIPDQEVRLYLCLGLVVGLSAGLILGLYIRQKALRQYQEIIDGIGELTSTNNNGLS